ncbi:hypothetical protein DLAC_11768 [Tieghemostelium lacteum]|uniref:PiggyBac transposable element-derived protein domain-containing protein n=1 Tax=Tieghemostelium lacteum TaxID=361077 RepID=A0A151Z9K9_TIELA|nr:hypothetical protein DLAC_11768 [Tieghemostelium lacteum]|eukprot:KYQ90640.1 hypothetical protein DLAC_11768 [Tieghemostelium lacteum]
MLLQTFDRKCLGCDQQLHNRCDNSLWQTHWVECLVDPNCAQLPKKKRNYKTNNKGSDKQPRLNRFGSDENDFSYPSQDENEIDYEFHNSDIESELDFTFDQLGSADLLKDIAQDSESETEDEVDNDESNNSWGEPFSLCQEIDIEKHFDYRNIKDFIADQDTPMLTKNWDCKHHPFSLKDPNAGPKNLPSNTQEPVDFFNLMFSDLIKDMHSTKRYISRIAANSEEKSCKPWIVSRSMDVSENDITKYLVIFFILGICRVPNIEDHWNPNDELLKSLDSKIVNGSKVY